MKPAIQGEWEPAAFCLAVHEFRKSRQSRTNLVNDENDDLLADSCNVSNLSAIEYMQG
jgi:hypothetical protein